jgi:hypothetical protein
MYNQIIFADNTPEEIPRGFVFYERKIAMTVIDKIALTLMIIGGLNWGLVGIFSFDLVAWLFGGTGAILSRVVYILVALSAVWSISLLFRDTELAESKT